MPYIVLEYIYPGDKASGVIEAYFEAQKKFPLDNELATMALPSISKSTHDGVKSINILEVKPGKLEAALKSLLPKNNMYSRIQGLTHSVDVYFSSDEIIETIKP